MKLNEKIKNENFSKDCFNSNPKDLILIKDLIKDSLIYYCLDNKFCVFKSINDILILIYVNQANSIISFNLIDEKIINEINRPHKDLITNLRYYLDAINKRDLILSISADDNNIKLWNINNFECLYDFNNINQKGKIYSACFLFDNNEIYVLTSNANWGDEFESIKVFDLNGNKISEINDSNEYTICIISYFDINLFNNYIITGNKGYIKSYSYKDNKVYHTYSYNDYNNHNSIIVYDNKEIIQIIESSSSGNIGIWNFHSGELLNKIETDNGLFGICLWNNDYLLAGSDKTIKIIEIKTRVIIDEILEGNDLVLTIKKIKLPKYGECLLSADITNNIKLYANKNALQ